MFWEQLKIEYKVYLRQPLYLLFSILMPVLSFVLFGGMYQMESYGGADFFSQYIPGFCAIILFASSVYNVGNQVVTDKEKGIYRRLAVTPVSMWRIMLAVILKAASVALASFAVILLLAHFVFHADMPNLPMFILAYFAFIIYSLIIGFGLGVIMDRVNTYAAVMMVLFMPIFILSDAMLPLQILPDTLRKIAYYNPMYRLILLLRPIWNPNVFELSSAEVRFSLVYLAVLMGLFLILVLFLWNRKKKNVTR